MKKVSLDKFAYPAISPSNVGGRNTVSNGPDDGTLNRLAPRFWNCKRHGSSAQAVDNLLIPTFVNSTPPVDDKNSTGACCIGGHGNDGQMEAGCGQTGAYDPNKYFLPWNDYAWGPQIDRLVPSPITTISLWGCHVGAGQGGADLLFAMAKRSGRAVQAGTGFLFVNDQSIWWENGSVWQIATPTNKPSPIEAPSPHYSIMTEQPKFQVGTRKLDVSEIVEIRIVSKDFGIAAQRSKSLKGTDALRAAEKLFISMPLEMNASILGFVTAQIFLTFQSGDTIEFDVYNDRLAVDQKSATAYYIDTTYRKLIETI